MGEQLHMLKTKQNQFPNFVMSIFIYLLGGWPG